MLPKCARRLATPEKYHDFHRSIIARSSNEGVCDVAKIKPLTIFFSFLKPTLIEECAMLPKCARRLATPGKYHDFLRSGIAPRSPYYTRGTQLSESIQNLNSRLGIQT